MMFLSNALFCFFFQAEDGIRGFHVTGVQTCALPISRPPDEARGRVAEQRAGATLSGSESAVGPDVRRDVLVEVIGEQAAGGLLGRVAVGDGDGSQARRAWSQALVRRLRRPCAGDAGDRESGRARRTRIELLPARRY